MDRHKSAIFGLRIPPKLKERLEKYSESCEKNKTEILLDALRYYLEKVENE